MMLLCSALSQSESEFIASFLKLHLVAAPLKRDEVIVLDEDHFHKRNNKKYMIKPDVPEAGFQISPQAKLNAVDWSKACGTNLKTSFSKFYLTLTLGDYFIELIRHFICIQKLAEERFKSSKCFSN